jgi:hypothetical protein
LRDPTFPIIVEQDEVAILLVNERRTRLFKGGVYRRLLHVPIFRHRRLIYLTEQLEPFTITVPNVFLAREDLSLPVMAVDNSTSFLDTAVDVVVSLEVKTDPQALLIRDTEIDAELLKIHNPDHFSVLAANAITEHISSAIHDYFAGLDHSTALARRGSHAAKLNSLMTRSQGYGPSLKGGIIKVVSFSHVDVLESAEMKLIREASRRVTIAHLESLAESIRVNLDLPRQVITKLMEHPEFVGMLRRGEIDKALELARNVAPHIPTTMPDTTFAQPPTVAAAFEMRPDQIGAVVSEGFRLATDLDIRNVMRSLGLDGLLAGAGKVRTIERTLGVDDIEVYLIVEDRDFIASRKGDIREALSAEFPGSSIGIRVGQVSGSLKSQISELCALVLGADNATVLHVAWKGNDVEVILSPKELRGLGEVLQELQNRADLFSFLLTCRNISFRSPSA